MKVPYNDIDHDINWIKTGDTVLIGGLYGENYKFINNRCGKVVRIFNKIEGDERFSVADVMLLSNKKIYTINFDYIFQLNNESVVDNISQHIFTIENCLLYYIHRKSIKQTMSFRDEMEQYMAICVDNNNKTHVLLFSGIS